MAGKRMFSKVVIDSDAFIDMPLSTQALYFHLSMRADDDGFVNNPKRIQRMIGCGDDDLKLLIAKSFIIPFDSGIVVITHWKIHNYIQKDRYKETVYLEEKSQLGLETNKAYSLLNVQPPCIQNVSKMEAQIRLDKTRLDEDSVDENSVDTDDVPDMNVGNTPAPSKPVKHIYGEFKHVRLTDDEVAKLGAEYGDALTDEAVIFLDEYIEMKGYKAKSHYLAIRKWVIDAVKERRAKQQRQVNQSSGRLDFIDNMNL